MFDHLEGLAVSPSIERPADPRRGMPRNARLPKIELPQTNAQSFEKCEILTCHCRRGRRQNKNRAVRKMPIARSLDQSLAPVPQFGLDGRELDAFLESQRAEVLSLGLVAPSQPDDVGTAITVEREFATARKSAGRICQRGEVGLLKPSEKVGLSAFRRGCLRKIPARVVAAKANDLGFRPNREAGNGRFHGRIVNGCHQQIASANPAQPTGKIQLEVPLDEALIASNTPVTPLNDAQLGGYFCAGATTLRRLDASQQAVLALSSSPNVCRTSLPRHVGPPPVTTGGLFCARKAAWFEAAVPKRRDGDIAGHQGSVGSSSRPFASLRGSNPPAVARKLSA